MAISAFNILNSIAGEDGGNTKLRDTLIVLRNSQAEAAVIPCPGGRVVSFKRIGGGNVILFPEALLDETLDSVPIPSADKPSGKEYYGFEVWLSPQSEWWIHQDLNPGKRESRSPWPPDPYHAYGKYLITRRTESSVSLQSPASPVTGITFEKNYTLMPDGVLNIKIRALNSGGKSCRWGIWTNTRLSGDSDFYAGTEPRPDGSLPITCKLFTKRPGKDRILQPKMSDGYFSFDKSEALKDMQHTYSNKAFIHCSNGVLAAILEKNLLVQKLCLKKDSGSPHHEHATAEVFQAIPAEAVRILELEFNGPYELVEPGEFIELEENWKLLEFQADKSIGEQITTF